MFLNFIAFLADQAFYFKFQSFNGPSVVIVINTFECVKISRDTDNKIKSIPRQQCQ